MYDVLCKQATSPCDHSFAHLATALTCDDRPTILEYFRTSSAMDRTVHTSATEQAGIGCVHDYVDLDLGDITLYNPDLHGPKIGTPGFADHAVRIQGPPRHYPA